MNPARKHIDKPLHHALAGLGFHQPALFLSHHRDSCFGEVPNHALHVAAVIAHLGILGGFDLDKGRADKLRQPAGDLGFADAGGPDHNDVLRGDILTHFFGQLLATPAIANGHGDGALGSVLANNMAIEQLNDLPRRQFSHGSSLLNLLFLRFRYFGSCKCTGPP